MRFLTDNGLATFGNVGSMLYVGHRHDTHPWWYGTFAPAIGAVSLAVIDIDAKNLQTGGKATPNLILGDVRTHPISGWGMVFWDEGPEHLPKEESLDVIRRLSESNARVLVSCPWGFQPQEKDPKNPEFHHWGPLVSDFEGIGMVARGFGPPPNDEGRHGGGNLIAWFSSPDRR